MVVHKGLHTRSTSGDNLGARRSGGAHTHGTIVKSMVDNFDFALVGAGSKFPFRGYVSSIDPTNAVPGVMVGGSQNVYKPIRGTIATRPGLKLRGTVDATLAGVASSFEWNTSRGVVLPLRVVAYGGATNKLQVEFDAGDGNGYVWRDLLTDLSLTRFVFDTWWDNGAQHDRILMAAGDNTLRTWSGGIGTIASATATTVVLTGSESATGQGFDSGLNTFMVNGVQYSYTGSGLSSATPFSQSPTNNKYSLSSTAFISQKFTSGSASTQVLTCTVGLRLDTGDTGVDVFVGALYTDNAGVPGTLIASAQATIGDIGGTNNPVDESLTFTFNQASSPNTNYHFVLYQQSGGTWKAYYGASGSVGTNNSTDAGLTWNAQNGYLSLTVTENTVTPQTLVGVSPNPSALAAKSVVIQTVKAYGGIATPGFALDFLKVIGNQAHLGSYSSRSIYVSSDSDPTLYKVPSVRAPGNPDLLTIDSLCRGITSQKDKNGQNTIAVISGGLGDWYTIGRAPLNVGVSASVQVTEQVSITKSEAADLATALAHEFITKVGDNILFVDQNNQLREFGTLRNIVNPVFPLLSLDVFNELKQLDLTGGALRAVADEDGETIYLTVPLSGTDYMYQIRISVDPAGNMHTERLWQPPQTRNLSRVAVVAGVTFGHSHSNPQLYQMWDTGQYHDDSPSGEGLPYECHMLLAYLNEGRTQGLTFDKLFAEGYMTQGTPLNCTVLQEYQGSKNAPVVVINGPKKNDKHPRFYSSQADVSLGQTTLVDNPLGDGLLTGMSNLPKFRCIRGVAAVGGMYEYALDLNSNTADAQWELLCIGTNQQPSTQLPTDIRS